MTQVSGSLAWSCRAEDESSNINGIASDFAAYSASHKNETDPGPEIKWNADGRRQNGHINQGRGNRSHHSCNRSSVIQLALSIFNRPKTTDKSTSGGGFSTNGRRRTIWIPTVLMVLFAVVALCSWLIPRPAADQSIYGFESGTMGWVQQTYEDSQGVTSVAQSTDRAKFGKDSLKLIVDLEGGHPNRSKGEAYVTIPVQNLEGKPITVWVYVPREALGDARAPNGIQVFVKDSDRNWRSEYGTWWDITSANVDDWQQVTLTPSRSAPPDGYMEPGFDPTQIRAVGLKVAIGEKSAAKFRGPIYIDAVNWPR